MKNFERKLAAIMFTDIYGYSRLMSSDEIKALNMLSEHDRVVENVIKFYKGNILKKMGDAILAEFNSSVDALNCAIKIQDDLKDYNSKKSRDERIIIRIGLHAGDVIVKDNDLFGEGINVAARLEPLADPGGICISQSVYESAKSHAEFDVIKVGNVELKNILEKYVVYKIPSIYGDEFEEKEKIERESESNFKYSLKKINNLPVKYLSPKEMTIFTLLFCTFWILFLAFFIQGRIDIGSLISFVNEEKLFIFPSIVFLVLAMIYFYANRSIRIIFDDIRDVDHLLAFLVSQIGYGPPEKEKNVLIFRPSSYQFFMYSARKIRALIDGNSVVITGNYMFVTKLIGLIRSYETAD